MSLRRRRGGFSTFLAAVNRAVSRRVQAHLAADVSRLLDQPFIRARFGRTKFRFWQEGPGYDRNLRTPQAVLGSMEYIHLNPVTRKLVQDARQ